MDKIESFVYRWGFYTGFIIMGFWILFSTLMLVNGLLAWPVSLFVFVMFLILWLGLGLWVETIHKRTAK